MKKKLLLFICILSFSIGLMGTFVTNAETNQTWDENLTMITFSKFRVPDGVYGVDTRTGLGFCGEYGKILDGTIFSGDVYFSDQKDVWLHYGALASNAWTGLRIRSNGDGTLVLHNSFDGVDIAVMTKENAQVSQLTETVLNLKISVQYMDMEGGQNKDDVKLGIWFNDKLYNNQYFELENLATKLGSTISCYVSNNACRFQAQSVDLHEKKESLNANLKQITLKQFGIADGKYQYTDAGTGKFGFEVNGGYAFSLENTVCSMDIMFSSKGGADLRYGGGESAWHGLRFDVHGDRIRMCDAAFNEAEGDKIYYFDSFLAGVQLLDATFNLKLSTEFVDYDGDGVKNDVKLGVWFNDVLYNNEYIYFTDYATEMGSNFTVLGSKEVSDSYIQLASDRNVSVGIDFSLYGFTQNWDKELGEEL